MKRLLCLMLLLPIAAAAPPPKGLTVFAAASLTNAMQDIATLWQAAGHPKVTLSFGSSATLAKQIEAGAPADVFASADDKWMDDLLAHRGIAPETRHDLIGNTLVLIEKKTALKPVTIGPGFDLGPILGADGRLAVGDPASVPAGIYASQALTKLGVWDRVSNHLAPAESVRAALLFVERGEAPAGIVYATDARISQAVGVAGTFPADSHEPIRYAFAVTHAGDTPQARGFLDFLATQPAKDVFEHYGFSLN